jgi:hypothetical protein
MKRGSLWAGTLEKRLQVGTQTQVIFELNPATEQTPLAVELQTIDAGGRPISYQFSYDEVGARLGLGDQTRGHNALGVNLIEREIGPIFEAARGAPADAVIASRRLAGDWAREIQELTSGEVGVSTIVTGVAREGLRPKLRFTLPRGTAARLAGPLSHSPVVWIGLSEDAPATPLSGSEYLPGTWTLATIETAPEVEVHPGHQLVRIDLPWGSWSATVIASPGGITDVELPSSIGDPPLRVLLNEELERKGSFLFGVGGRTPRPLLRNGLAGREAIDYRQAREGSARWAFAAPSAAWIRKPGAVAIATAGGWSFPHLYGRSLGLAYVGRRRHVRIEPLSRVPSAAWDLLLGRGLLDVLSEEEAALLTYNKYDDPLLGLAGAYAVYALPTAKNKDQFLTTVVANLRRLSEQPGGMKVPDIDLLSAAHTARTAKRATPTDEAILESWATRGAVPVLRWGVPLAVRLIQDGVLSGPSFERWHGELQRINENLSPISVWTAWRPTRARRLGSPSRDRATPPSSS